MSGTVPKYQDFDMNCLSYASEVNVNKKTGAKSVKVSTVPGSNSIEHNVRFQLGVYETGELLRAPFGVSTPMQGQEASVRRDLDLSIESDDMVAFLRALDERNLQAAVDNSMAWFKREIDKPVLRDRFRPLVKDPPPSHPEYRPTVRTKLVVDAERGNTDIFLVTKEDTSGPVPRIVNYERVSMNEIARGSKVIAIVESNGCWIGANQFGMSLTLTSLLVWPTRQSRGIEAFALAHAPTFGAVVPPHVGESIAMDDEDAF